MEIQEVRRQAEPISAKNGRLEGGLDRSERDLEIARKETHGTLAKQLETERATHTDALRAPVGNLRDKVGPRGSS